MTIGFIQTSAKEKSNDTMLVFARLIYFIASSWARAAISWIFWFDSCWRRIFSSKLFCSSLSRVPRCSRSFQIIASLIWRSRTTHFESARGSTMNVRLRVLSAFEFSSFGILSLDSIRDERSPVRSPCEWFSHPIAACLERIERSAIEKQRDLQVANRSDHLRVHLWLCDDRPSSFWRALVNYPSSIIHAHACRMEDRRDPTSESLSTSCFLRKVTTSMVSFSVVRIWSRIFSFSFAKTPAMSLCVSDHVQVESCRRGEGDDCVTYR